MQRRAKWIGALLCVVGAVPSARAQDAISSEGLIIGATSASTWSDDRTNIVQLHNDVQIQLADAHMQADQAVIWLTPSEQGMFEILHAEIVLLGNASVERDGVVRSGDQLRVTGTVRGRIRVSAQRRAIDETNSPIYREALTLRAAEAPTSLPEPSAQPLVPQEHGAIVPSGSAGAQPNVLLPDIPVDISIDRMENVETTDGKITAALSGNVLLMQRRPNGDLIELHAQRAVIYTNVERLSDMQVGGKLQTLLRAAYLEGDVRVDYTPASNAVGEQRLRADRVYYDFETDRAVLTDAVLHTTDPKIPVPIIMRAKVLRQLALGEYNATDVQLTTSEFATPSYSLAAQRAYVRAIDPKGTDEDQRTIFRANNATVNTFGMPVLWFPYAGGTVADSGVPLRNVQVGNNRRFGTFVKTEWGLFETLGSPRPRNLDASYRLDYYSDRGPATGLDMDYRGGFVTDTEHEPWNFNGKFTSFLVHDSGEDDFGGQRANVEPEDELRGRALLEHQHILPDDWQLQFRAAWVSDPTFLEEWFEREWDSNQEHDLSLYLKRQRNTEALTFLVDIQPNNFVTTSDLAQEQFEIERYPEIGYYRVGDDAGDFGTYFAANRVSALSFNDSGASLADQGYYFGVDPGTPSIGQTGTEDTANFRGDFRHEVDFPFSLGTVRFLPYVFGRVTAYSDSPTSDNETRLMSGAGMRITTAFWKVDNTVQSDLFDLHRMRHIIEPELHLLASAQSVDATELYIYDEDVDKVSDLQAVQIALRQRWQTKRGGPGRWRSVDVFTLNIEGTFYGNEPSDTLFGPEDFRGLFFYSMPEASIPRDGINVDGTWRVTDSTILLGDISYNIEESTLATASIGVAVQRDDRLTWFLGTRYIEPLDSNITTASIIYKMSARYSLALQESFDFGENEGVLSAASIIRRFDRFATTVTFYHDERDDDSGVRFSVAPDGLGGSLGSNTFAERNR